MRPSRNLDKTQRALHQGRDLGGDPESELSYCRCKAMDPVMDGGGREREWLDRDAPHGDGDPE